MPGRVPARSPGVAGLTSDISILGPRDAAAVLLLHGLTGTPNELHVLGDAIAGDGHTVQMPLLPGRGTRPSDMDALSWDDWMDTALSAFDALAAMHPQVIVGGLSAGGTMALDIALRRPVCALLLYAAPLYLRYRAAYLAPVLWPFVRRWRSPRSDLVDEAARAHVSVYDPVPVRAIAELVRGMRRVRPRLRDIQVPALVVHATADRYVPVGNATELARRLGGPVRLELLSGSGHAVTADAVRDEVATISRDFIADQTAGRTPSSEGSTLPMR